jgi:hypothetical protein
MKKLIIPVLILFATISFGNNNDALRKQISKNIAYPQFLKKPDADEKVTVRFTVTAQGKVEVVSITAKINELKQYVTNELKSMKIKENYSEPGVVYSVELSFKMKKS